jgi:hypothetical protein
MCRCQKAVILMKPAIVLCGQQVISLLEVEAPTDHEAEEDGMLPLMKSAVHAEEVGEMRHDKQVKVVGLVNLPALLEIGIR